MINSEDDVRAWVREASVGKARWVEPALGSTPGLPDCWVPWENRKRVDLELKCGEIRNNGLYYSVRPEQVREIRLTISDCLACGLLVGVKQTNSLFFIVPDKLALNGLVKLTDEDSEERRFHATLDDRNSFWQGVNFIGRKTARMGGGSDRW